MSTVSQPSRVTVPPLGAPQQGHPEPRATRIDLVVLGLLFSAVGLGWLLSVLGIDVRWSLAAPIALGAVGVILLAMLMARADSGRNAGRLGLAWIGAALLVVSLVLGVDAPRYAAPIGNVDIAPTPAEWPLTVHRSTGNVEVDLTRNPLPERGSLEVRVGAGNVTLTVPTDPSLMTDVRLTAGTLRVDGRTVDDGVDVRWSSGRSGAPVIVTVDVAAGEVTVRHA